MPCMGRESKKAWLYIQLTHFAVHWEQHNLVNKLCVCSVTQLLPTLCDPVDCQPTRLVCPWNFPGMFIGVGGHFLLQQIFLTQEWNLHLLHWQVASLPLAPLWMPKTMQTNLFVVFAAEANNIAWIRCSRERRLNHGTWHDCSANTLPSHLHGRCFLILTTPAWSLVMSFFVCVPIGCE